jgi:hypothetical protein
MDLRKLAFRSRLARWPLNVTRHLGLSENDVFVASYPRSGTTWFRFLLYELLAGEPSEFPSVNAQIPYVGAHRRARGLLPHDGRLIKTHESYKRGVRAAIYVVRDPRSVVVSEHRWELRTGLSDQPFDRFFDAFLQGKANPYDRWDLHVQGWLGSTIASRGRVHLVRFEDLTRDTVGELQGVLRFLGVNRDASRIAEVVANNDLAHMREKEERAPGGTVGAQRRPEIRFINAGSTEAWVDHLSDEHIGELERRFTDTMGQLGYESRARPSSIVGAPRDKRDEVKVLYIAGWGRSGSTFLDTMLGQLPRFFSTGEVRYLWDRGVLRGWTCGCGELVRDCPIWSEVLRRLENDGETRPAKDIVQWQHQVTRIRHSPRLVRRPLGGTDNDRILNEYVDVTGRLFRSIADVSGARVIVDSSKRPSDAAVLGKVPGVSLHIVHLVRDPRAVAYSWSQRQEGIDRHGILSSTTSWVGWNVATEDVRRQLACPSLLVRYEDFVERPLDALRRIVNLVGEDSASVDTLDPPLLRLAPTHTVSGNPSRLRSGPVEITPDQRWVSGLPWWQKAAASAVASPLMGRYGYPLIPPRSR